MKYLLLGPFISALIMCGALLRLSVVEVVEVEAEVVEQKRMPLIERCFWKLIKFYAIRPKFVAKACKLYTALECFF